MKQNHEFCNELDADKLIATALKCLEDRLTYATGEKFTSSRLVCDYLRLQLSHEKNEVFAVMFMDNQHRLLGFEKLFNGTVNEAVIYPRCVVQKAIQYNAAVIIVAHNHPSGVVKPSMADEQITRDLKKILEIINVKLLDHIVVTLHEVYSFAEHGLL
jgi:DNA repair protein RadC